MTPPDKHVFAIWVSQAFFERFAELARRNDRSASGEGRLALKRHLEAEEARLRRPSWPEFLAELGAGEEA